ncbi:MAG: LysR substrate-binding domain-containing protein [Alphaproteobacteria bacterium]
MELRNVDYFLTVANEGSIRAAARKLGLTQPALTKAVRRLEDEAGVALFARQARGVTLTTYGEVFLRHARALKASMVEASSEIEALRRGAAGLVRIGAGPSWLARTVPAAIRRFQKERPRAQVQISGGLDDALKASLRAGELDLVLAALPDRRTDGDLGREPLSVDDYRVIADVGHPLHRKPTPGLAELLAYPWILPRSQTFMVSRLDALFRSKGLPTPEPAIETDVVTTKLELMRGSDFLSFHAIANLSELGAEHIRPLPVAEPGWTREAGLIWRRDIDRPPLVEALAAIIRELCRERAGH